jgi:general secretion pathway protein I
MKGPVDRNGAARARGFTLIEVLAALVIVALGMLGVIEAVTQTARNGTYLRDKTLAHWIAMNVVTEQRLQTAPPAIAETSDDVDFAGQRWHWTMRVTQTEVSSLRRMDVSVRPADAADGTELATVTGFYGTAVGAAGGGTLDWSGENNQAAQKSQDTGEEGQGSTKGRGGGTSESGSTSTGDTTGKTPAPQPTPEEDE